MAPEVMLEGRASKAADVYAFGITLWELFTGGVAFRGAFACDHVITFWYSRRGASINWWEFAPKHCRHGHQSGVPQSQSSMAALCVRACVLCVVEGYQALQLRGRRVGSMPA
jgi:hypothetical protein